MKLPEPTRVFTAHFSEKGILDIILTWRWIRKLFLELHHVEPLQKLRP
jgi:hypothetical protein